MDTKQHFLTTVDYIVIATALFISAMIGLYFRFAGSRQQTMQEYLQAGRNMKILPVSISLMATYMSTSTMMGVSAEVYLYGIPISFFTLGLLLGMLTSTFVFLPVYFSAQVSTSYEYLEKRYGSIARTACSLGFTMEATIFMSIVLYTPALALSAVTNLSTWVSVISLGAICTFYCTLGGMKAVIWTDVFQVVLMFICTLSIVTKGALDMGGFSNILRISEEGGRLELPNFSASIALKYTAWNLILQGFTIGNLSYGTSQLQLHRLLSVRNCLISQLSSLASIPITAVFSILCWLCGLVFYAAFHKCDPSQSPEKMISSVDQIMPYYIVKHLSDYPGLPGFCICGIFAASLSTVSSSIQALTVVTMEDFLHPFCKSCSMSQARLTLCAKAITLFYGLLAILLSFIVATIGNIVKATIVLFSMMGGPILGVFLLAVLTTTANEKGAVLGMICSFILAIWLSFGPFTAISEELPLSIEGCPSLFINTSTHFTIDSSRNGTFTLHPTIESDISGAFASNEHSYLLSYMWVNPIALVTCIVLGYVFSVLIDCFTGQKKSIPSELSSPVLLWIQKNILRELESSEEQKTKEELEIQTKL